MAKVIIVKRRMDHIHNVRWDISKKRVCYGVTASTKSAITFGKNWNKLDGLLFHQ